MRRTAAALAAIALCAAACTAADRQGPSEPRPSLDTLPGAPTGGQLLILTGDGTILTASEEGGTPATVRVGGELEVGAQQPVWSPDGRRIAWVEAGTGGPPATSVLVTARPDGSGRREVPVDAAMFFLQWDPTSSRVAYLGSYQSAVGVGVAEPDARRGASARTIGVGQPFYMSWSPRGDRLLIHVGADTLGWLDFDGTVEHVGDAPGVFHAPVWLADGRLIYAVGEGNRQALVVRDGERVRELVGFRGAIEFVVSPEGDRVAYRVDGEDGLGTVAVAGLRSGRTTPVSDVPTSAFHWSPDGSHLLLMTPVEGENPAAHRWLVWDDGEPTPIGPTFLPSPTYLRDYLPFFGQYAQTMTLWSPDGGSFAFPGLIDDRAGIWVQDLDAEAPRFVVEDGMVVAWSPVDA